MFVVRLPCLGSTSIIYHTIRNIPQNIGLERPKVLVSLPFAARCCDQLHSGHSGTATFSPMAKRSSARCFFCGKSRALANVDFGHLPPRYLFPQKAGNVQDLKCLKPKDMKVKDSYQNHPSGDQMFTAKSSFGRSSLTRRIPDIWAPLGTPTACFGRPQLEGLTQPRFPPAGGQHKTFQHMMPWGLWIHHENHGKNRAKKNSNAMDRL